MNGFNFTERVRKVLAMAREEAGRLGHEYVGTEHELLGILREGEGVAATVLQSLGVDLEELKDSLEEIVKKGNAHDKSHFDLPYTSRAKKTLELAMSEARDLNHAYVGTEHLLLGLLREHGGLGAQVLIDRGITLDNARIEVLSILGTDVDKARRVERPTGKPASKDSVFFAAQPRLSDRVRDVMRDAEHVATELHAAELMPIHVAVALLRNREGIANAILDRFDVDRPALVNALMNEARNAEPAATLEPRVTFGSDMGAFQRQVESESRRRSSPPTTLDILLVLLDTVKEVALIFETQGIDAARVRAEAKRVSG